MTRGKLAALGAGGVAAIAAVLALVFLVLQPGTAASVAPVATSIPVALSAKDVPADTVIGVVVTLGSETGGGAQWKDAAQGAAVAERRFSMGGTPITLATRNDKGTVSGARAAVGDLVAEGAAGIVIATDGAHLQGAFEAATAAGIPLVLPYYSGKSTDGSTAWRTGAAPEKVSAALNDALAGAAHVLLIDAGGDAPAQVPTASVLDFAPGDDATKLALEAARRTGAAVGKKAKPVRNPADAILLSGTAWQQGIVVQALQAANIAVPVVLTPAATSPAFANSLQAAGGTFSGRLLTVGPDDGDAVALRKDASGRGMSAFLTGIRVLAGDPNAKNLTGDMDFAQVAGSADARSHDAIVSMVRAVSGAGSNDPKLVGTALKTLQLGAAEGIAGPALDFSGPEALTGAPVQLNTSLQDLGLRPATTGLPGTGTTAIWFAGASSN